jgi:amino acid transporter
MFPIACRSEAAASFTPFLPKGPEGVVIAMGLTFIAFEGYNLIATVAEEIKAPEKTIPRAMFLSMFVSLSFYLAVVLLVTYPETPGSFQGEEEKNGPYQQAKQLPDASAS